MKDNRAQGGAVSFFIGAMIAVVVALQVAWPVMDASIYGGEGTASGALTFSGNVSNGELVNITNGAAIYRFEFNTTANGSNAVAITTNAIVINLSRTAGTTAYPNPLVYNNSYLASGNLTAAINANASTLALVTAANTTNKTTITAVASGKSYNSIATSENGAAIVWGAATLTGGGDRATKNMSGASTVLVVQLPLFLILVLLMVFVKAVI